MATRFSNSYHDEYLDVTQHWSEKSEPYAGGDALVTLLSLGWELQQDVDVEERYFAGLRSVSVYHLYLKRDGETMHVPVLRNPYVNRILRMGEFNLNRQENKNQ